MFYLIKKNADSLNPDSYRESKYKRILLIHCKLKIAVVQKCVFQYIFLSQSV